MSSSATFKLRPVKRNEKQQKLILRRKVGVLKMVFQKMIYSSTAVLEAADES